MLGGRLVGGAGLVVDRGRLSVWGERGERAKNCHVYLGESDSLSAGTPVPLESRGEKEAEAKTERI